MDPTIQNPEDCVSEEEFSAIHVFIITKPKLKNKIITINALGKKILGCPVCLDNPKYNRNALIFNFCMVFDNTEDTLKYENMVQKLASYFTTLETESDFLSTEETKKTIPSVLEQIRREVNLEGMCSIPIRESSTLYLNVMTEKDNPILVNDYDVPIVRSHRRFTSKQELAVQQLLTYVDGFRHVRRIAVDADVDINFVKQGIRNLVHMGVLSIVSIFQYSNEYVATQNINKLASDSFAQEQCRQYVAYPDMCPEFHDIFTMYCGLRAGTTVQDLCARFNPRALGIDERNLIQYGQMMGYIHRLYKYPVKLPNEPGSHRMAHLYKWFNGSHHYDEICAATGLSHRELDEKTDSDPSIVICWK